VGEVARRRYLDGLRGVAALMVFFAHLTISLMPAVVTFNPGEAHSRFDAPLGASPLALIWAGNSAVCIFFVLSGFVLSEFCQHSRLSFPAQMLRRYLRLVLPMLITSGFALVLLYFGLYKTLDAANEATKSGWLSMWYRAFDPSLFGMIKETVYTVFATGKANYNCNLWTMQIELFGSAYVFLAFALIGNKRLRIAAWIVFGAIHYSDYYCLFAIGGLLYDLDDFLAGLSQRFALPVNDQVLNIFVFGIGMFLCAFPYIQLDMTDRWFSWLSTSHKAQAWHMVGAPLLVGALLHTSSLQALFRHRIPQFLGRISFVLYLIHIPVICSLTAWIAFAMRGTYYPYLVLTAGAATIITVLSLSNLLYKFVDIHTTAWSRIAAKWLDSVFQPPLRAVRASEP
jgi:peptidoglycan/LPS O-acetylase OafA/YrhL